MNVQFRETDATGKPVHEYSVAGVKTPSVTYILDKRGFCNYQDCPEDYMEAARERGQIGHEVTHWFDEKFPGVLVSELEWAEMFEVNHLEEPLHPWSRQILQAWIDFRIEFGFEPTLIEKPLAWKINGMMVCGTPDRFGTSKLGPMVIDLKFTSKVEASCKYQLAAYAANPELHTRGQRPLRYVAHFKEGKCIPVPFTRSKDEAIFAAALSITHDLWNGGGK
jgi:CRISPR/Cas system-associated exonuclease Cas4 (RecB family)